MEKTSNHSSFARLIKVLCGGILCALFAVGLFPFQAPKNQVEWLDNRNGLQFSRFSSILSAVAFHAKAANYDTPESIELWAAPNSLRSTSTIASFDGSDHPGVGFLLRQYKDALVVRQHYVDNQAVSRVEWLTVAKAVHEATPIFVTITLGKQGTSIYLDGVLGEAFATLGTSANNLTGRLVLANSPQANDSWPGQILGLAMYRSQLTPEQVAEHYESWTKTQQPVIREDEAPFAVYLFNERKGNIVRNQLDSAGDLIIPERYFVLHPRVFSSVVRDYRANRQYWQDIGVNLAGFIPLGFCVAIYLSEVYAIKRPAAATIAVGLLISLTIESLQVFLPTRSSGSTDLITNTLGTAIGVLFYRSSLARGLLTCIREFRICMNVSVGVSPGFRSSSDSTTPSVERTSPHA